MNAKTEARLLLCACDEPTPMTGRALVWDPVLQKMCLVLWAQEGNHMRNISLDGIDFCPVCGVKLDLERSKPESFVRKIPNCNDQLDRHNKRWSDIPPEAQPADSPLFEVGVDLPSPAEE